MDRDTLRRAWMLVMLVLLIATAPQWIQPGAAKVSGYDAPWIYPGLEPAHK